MKTYFKFVEYAYLLIGLFFIEELIRTWGKDDNKNFLFGVFAIICILMYFFRRWWRKKMKREKLNQ